MKSNRGFSVVVILIVGLFVQTFAVNNTIGEPLRVTQTSHTTKPVPEPIEPVTTYKMLPVPEPKPETVKPHKMLDDKAGIEESKNNVRESKKVALHTTAVELGKALFFDPILSKNGKVSCASCHDPKHAYASNGLAIGIDGKPLALRAPSILNRARAKVFFWNGRANSLEQQAIEVINNPHEMGNDLTAALGRLRVHPVYGPSFHNLYFDSVTPETVAHCLTEFERTLTHTDRRFDSFLEGKGELTTQEARGYDLFRGPAQCYKCHTGPFFTDDKFHNTGTGWPLSDPVKQPRELGRYSVTRDLRDYLKFKTPGLRDCKSSSPYFHNASARTLEDVIEFYDKGGRLNPDNPNASNLSPLIKPLNLRSRDKTDLLAFLKAI